MKIEIEFHGEQNKGRSDDFYYKSTIIFNGEGVMNFKSLSKNIVRERTTKYVDDLMISEDI